MAVTAALSIEAPEKVSALQAITLEEIKRLMQTLTWAYTYRNENHITGCFGDDDWDDYPASTCGSDAGVSKAVGTTRLMTTGTNTTVIETDIYVDPDEAQNGTFTCGVETFMTTADTVVVTTFDFNGDLGTVTGTVTRTGSAHNNAEGTADIAISSATVGSNWIRCRIQIQRTGGTATEQEIRTLRVTAKVPTTYATPADT